MPQHPSSRSGEQHEIRFGAHHAIVTEVGAGLRSYTVDGRDIVDGYDVDQICPSGRGQILAPWPNRLEDGTYDFDGGHHQLPLNEPEAGNAIHGLVRWAPWKVRAQRPDHVTLEYRLHPQPGYPFSLALTVAYTLADDGITVHTAAQNVGSDACPYGIGAHPYLTFGSVVDDLMLSVPARTVWQSDERGLPKNRAQRGRNAVRLS